MVGNKRAAQQEPQEKEEVDLGQMLSNVLYFLYNIPERPLKCELP